MGWLSVLISAISAFLMWEKGHAVLMAFAIIVSIGCLWSWGVMHNYATNSAEMRSRYKGDFYDFTQRDINSVPDWITWANMGLSLLGGILLIAAVLLR